MLRVGMIEYRFLGPAEVRVDGDAPPPELRWRKNLALAAYLICSAGRPSTRDHLTGLLWAEKPDHSARHSLREALRSIRKNAGSDSLAVEGEQITLDLNQLSVDLGHFDEFVSSGDLRSAWNSVRGEFMEGFAVPDSSGFEDWLLSERMAWGRKMADVATGLSNQLLDSGDDPAALLVLEKACSIFPDSEPLGRLLIRAHSLAGDRTGAIKAFEVLESRLDALGITPATETVRLVDLARSDKDWASAPADMKPRALSSERRLPLTGRGLQLARGLELWSSCLENSRSTVIVVEGDPGSGKSRFSEELIARTRLDGAQVANVRAVLGDQTEPFSGLVGIASGGLGNSLGVLGTDPEALGVIGAKIPEWRDRFSPGKPTPGALSFGNAVLAVLLSITEESPVAILVDDAHFVDAESLEVLAGFVRSLAERRFFLVLNTNCGQSTPEIDELRARMGREVTGGVLKLAPLDLDEIAELAGRVLPEYEPAAIERVARRLVEDTAGLPVLVVEMLHAVAQGLELERFENAWPSPLQTLDQTMPGDLPDSVVGAIRVGFRKLSDDAQEVVSAAAVISGRISQAQFEKVLDLPRKDLEKALDETEWLRWLAAEPRGYSFVARIVREVVLKDLVSVGKRQRIQKAARS